MSKTKAERFDFKTGRFDRLIVRMYVRGDMLKTIATRVGCELGALCNRISYLRRAGVKLPMRESHDTQNVDVEGLNSYIEKLQRDLSPQPTTPLTGRLD